MTSPFLLHQLLTIYIPLISCFSNCSQSSFFSINACPTAHNLYVFPLYASPCSQYIPFSIYASPIPHNLFPSPLMHHQLLTIYNILSFSILLSPGKMFLQAGIFKIDMIRDSSSLRPHFHKTNAVIWTF